MTCKIYLSAGKGKNAENGHPWIYSTEIDIPKDDFNNGDIVDVYNNNNKFIGRGYINTNSKIIIRILTRDKNELIDECFFRKRLKNAWEYRKKVVDTSSCRLLFGEADFVPGLIIDKYNDYFVTQFLSLGIDKYKNIIVKILKEDFSAKGVYERDDLPIRQLEGLPQTKGFLTEAFDTKIQIEENKVKYIVDLDDSQKTGFFLDQKQNRKAIHKICKDAKVLDCFTNTGAFALNAGISGAKSVIGIDISKHYIKIAEQNAKLNNLSNIVSFECCNVFDALHSWSKAGEKFDVVILDPPSFAKSKSNIKSAIRGYKEINLRAMKILNSGGYLVTCSCSHFIKSNLFLGIIKEAARDSRKLLRQVDFKTQSSDFPILCGTEETSYLKFYIFQVI